MRLMLIAAALAAALPSLAHAELTSTGPSMVVSEHRATVSATPEAAFRTLTRINRWWTDAHTYSGDAGRLSLDARAGGCWCERWDGQSVEHARVVLVMESEGTHTLRVVGGLGPLQEMGVNAVLTFTVAPHADGANIVWTYRVSGDASLNLDRIAPLVDQVIAEQFVSYRRLLDARTN